MVDQVDRLNAVVASTAIKRPCRSASNTNITLSGEQTVLGVALVSGDRCLVTAQTDPIENGIYDVSTAAWTRSADFDGNRDVVNGTLIPVKDSGGVANYSIYMVDTADPITIGTTSLTISLVTLNLGAFPQIVGTSPALQFNDTDQDADQKISRIESFGAYIRFTTRDDNNDPGEDWLRVYRDAAGVGIARVEFQNADLRPASSAIKVKSTFTSKTSDTTIAADPHLAGFVLEADARYSIEGFLWYLQNIGDIKFDFSFSNLPQTSARLAWYANDESGVTVHDLENIQSGADIAITTMTDSNNAAIVFHGAFQANATTGGTLDFRWAQNTSSANATTLQAQSWIKVTKLASS